MAESLRGSGLRGGERARPLARTVLAGLCFQHPGAVRQPGTPEVEHALAWRRGAAAPTAGGGGAEVAEEMAALRGEVAELKALLLAKL